MHQTILLVFCMHQTRLLVFCMRQTRLLVFRMRQRDADVPRGELAAGKAVPEGKSSGETQKALVGPKRSDEPQTTFLQFT